MGRRGFQLWMCQLWRKAKETGHASNLILNRGRCHCTLTPNSPPSCFKSRPVVEEGLNGLSKKQGPMHIPVKWPIRVSSERRLGQNWTIVREEGYIYQMGKLKNSAKVTGAECIFLIFNSTFCDHQGKLVTSVEQVQNVAFLSLASSLLSSLFVTSTTLTLYYNSNQILCP